MGIRESESEWTNTTKLIGLIEGMNHFMIHQIYLRLWAETKVPENKSMIRDTHIVAVSLHRKKNTPAYNF